MKHTPGPWKVAGQYRAHHQDEVRLRIDGPKGYIALTEPYNGSNKEIVANAHLIAAAPDLLEALEKILVLNATQGVGYDEWEGATEMADKAIAKAEGE
jgi:hypothetical protein